MNKRRKDDPEFKERFKQALYTAHDNLEREAWRRATTGRLRPVYQGGKKVGFIRERSNALLMFLLKGARPEKYREHATIKHKHSGKVANVGSSEELRELSTEELLRFEKAFAARSGGTGLSGRN